MGYIAASIALLALSFLLIVLLILAYRKNADMKAAFGEQEKELEKQTKLALLASKSKSRFLSVISHEIRTPLNAILGIADIELQKKPAIPNKDAMEKITASGENLLGIINDLIDMSKLDTGKLEIVPARYSLVGLICDTARLGAMKIGHKPIEFRVNADENLPTELVGDELRIKQVVNNLLSNAIKYTDQGSIDFTILCSEGENQNTPSSSHEKQPAPDESICLTFIVSDTGRGLAPEIKEKLLSEDFAFYAEANRTSEGIGLGLDITRRLVDMMGGKISIESTLYEGTTFSVAIKQTPVICEPFGEERVEKLKNFASCRAGASDGKEFMHHPMPYGSVLIVDDSKTNLFVAEGLLAPYGLSVDTADSGFLALAKLRGGKAYDVIFMDHMMPLMDGIETTKRLRGIGYQGAVVALTANAMAGNAAMFAENGFDAYLPKPIAVKHLDNILNEFIRDRHPEEAKKHPVRAVKEESAKAPVPDALKRVFVREARKALVTLKDSFANGDLKTYAITSHALKSALLNVEEPAASKIALLLEEACQNSDRETISHEAPAFYAKLESIINKHSQAEAPAEPPTDMVEVSAEDKDLLLRQLERIKEALDNYDRASVLAILDTLLGETSRPDTLGTLKNIRDALLWDSDFDSARETTDALISSYS